MGEAREVGIAQNEADVGMGDQAALGVYHIGIAALADLDLRDHVPNELEIDLCDADPRVASRPRQRQRHVGLGFMAEINRAVIDLVRDGLEEFRVVGEVALAADDIHGQVRDAQLLAAGRVELGELGNRRYLTQQPQSVEAPLLLIALRPRQLCRPTDLALDLLDELADLGRRRVGLALNVNKRGFVLLIGKPHLEQTVSQQGNTDHADEQRHVFAKQPAANCGRSFARCRWRNGSAVIMKVSVRFDIIVLT